MKKRKKSKPDVNYRPKTTKQNCGLCTYMQDDGHCTKVAGFVDRQHVCDLFERKS